MNKIYKTCHFSIVFSKRKQIILSFIKLHVFFHPDYKATKIKFQKLNLMLD